VLNHGSYLKVALLLCGFNAFSADTVPPTVAIATPEPNAIVSGSINFAADAKDDLGVVGVSFWVDLKLIASEDTTAPYSVTLDTATLRNGLHILTAIARDAANRIAVSRVTIQVQNSVPRRRVMPLGDSLTYGFVDFASPNNEDGGYRRSLWEKLTSIGFSNRVDFVGTLQTGLATIDPDHEGHPGYRIDDVTNEIPIWLTATKPQIIMLMIGTNDLDTGATPRVALERLVTLLNTISTLAPGTHVIVSSLIPVRVNNTHPAIRPREIIEFNIGTEILVRKLNAQGKKISFVDTYWRAALDTSMASLDYGPDGLHPSPRGYAKIAHVWFSTLTPLLFRNWWNDDDD
jgi:lysophospholipase L1-like esterase